MMRLDEMSEEGECGGGVALEEREVDEAREQKRVQRERGAEGGRGAAGQAQRGRRKVRRRKVRRRRVRRRKVRVPRKQLLMRDEALLQHGRELRERADGACHVRSQQRGE